MHGILSNNTDGDAFCELEKISDLEPAEEAALEHQR